MSQFFFHRSYSFVSKSTGIDVIKVGQICIYIECKAMHCHVTGASNTDGANFTAGRLINIEPHTSGSLEPRSGNIIYSQCFYNGFFNIIYILLQPDIKVCQIEDRITYQLSGSMIGNVSTSVRFHKYSIFYLKLHVIQQQIEKRMKKYQL